MNVELAVSMAAVVLAAVAIRIALQADAIARRAPPQEPAAPQLGTYAGDGYHACKTCGALPEFHVTLGRWCVPPMPPRREPKSFPATWRLVFVDAMGEDMVDVCAQHRDLAEEQHGFSVGAELSIAPAGAVCRYCLATERARVQASINPPRTA